MEKKENKKNPFISGKFYILVFSALTAIILFITASLWDFKNEVYEREHEVHIHSLEDLAAQGGAVLEERLRGYLNTLNGIAPLFEDGDLWSEEKMEILKELLAVPGIQISRMGVADRNGQAVVTNGRTLDISDTDYFKGAMNDENVISGSRNSRLVDEQVFMVAVPLHDTAEEVRGVLYGIVELEKFKVFEETSLDAVDHYIKVIDRNGDYLVNTAEFHMKVQGANVFDVMEQIDSSVPAEEAQKRVAEGEEFLAQVNDGEQDYLAYFTPLKEYEWYVVTVMDREGILEQVQYLLGKDLYILTMEIGLAFALVCVWIAWLLRQDKKKTEKAYRQLQINSKMIQTAFSCTNNLILIYNGEVDQLKIVNGENTRIPLPEVIDHASANLVKLLPDYHKTRSQVEQIFQKLSTMKADEDFEIFLKIDGEIRCYLLHVMAVESSEHKVVRNVGIVEDITEKRNLKELAETDYLTGIYNRRSATERINRILAIKPDTGRKHAFVILDLDDFKKLNDVMGHKQGDQALIEVAAVLEHHFRESDVISRLAGDEFVVLIRNIPEEVLREKMKQLLEKLRLTYTENGLSVRVTASAGVAEAPRDGTTFDMLYENADKALYQAKEKGKNTCFFYRAEPQ